MQTPHSRGNDMNTKTCACEVSAQNNTYGDEEGSPILFVVINYIFFKVWPHAKFQNPSKTQSGRKVSEMEREKEREEKKTVNRGHFSLPPTMPKGSACSLLKPTFDGFLDCVCTFNGLLCWSVI